ncbi:hypothetical protein [Nostoc sp.]|uniref:hypothetical protein n=1 Tax=Nostoc sp. TaxID=1180 RepID=UPI002FF4A5EB
MYLLDTDVLIDIQRGHAPAITWFASLVRVAQCARLCGHRTNPGCSKQATAK